MSKPRTITHATFAIERVFPHPPARVYGAFATTDAKARWFTGPDGWSRERWDLDFRPGGVETSIVRGPNGPRVVFEARYYELLANERIVYSYEMHIGDDRISVSLATIELRPEGKGTRLVITEQGAFLDGLDEPSRREEGTNWLMDNLARALEA